MPNLYIKIYVIKNGNINKYYMPNTIKWLTLGKRKLVAKTIIISSKAYMKKGNSNNGSSNMWETLQRSSKN